MQEGRLEALKDSKLIASDDELFGEELWDASLLGAYPAREWVNGATLRLGGDTSSQPSADEFVVSNRTGRPLKLV